MAAKKRASEAAKKTGAKKTAARKRGQVKTETVFDRTSDRYLLVIVGQDGKRRVHGCLVHIDIEGDKVVIQRDGTEQGMAPDLARAGIAPERIVLAFHHRGARPYSDFLAA